ncbi:RluA family pseudouridine synthase [Clostridium minihomine]|uniref:RluA family pseudouridine synthase n=1 Tax=Clostridium minihomine TaxID=2045012 RepID=UPI000C787E2B|nr:RluA family pseudouridine synthase [Clostridium minihomine]
MIERTGIEKKGKKRQCVPVELRVEEPAMLMDFLVKNLKGKSRNNVKSLLTRGAVLVEGRPAARYDHPLRPGQTVQVRWAPQALQRGGRRLEILYEDEELLVINKPAGLLSIATDEEKKRTAYHLMTEHVRENDPDKRIFVVHRLDRDTSGVLLAAKTPELKYALQEQWADLVLTRGYTAVVEGCPQPLSGRVHTWLKETKTTLMYSSERSGDGQEAITDYQVVGMAPGNALVDIRLKTGRKNQIRVHMKELGCPVVGDKKYGAKTNPFHRLGLHAGILELRHPVTGEILRFEAKVPTLFFSIPFQR